MNHLILLFLSFPLVFSAESKCPEQFTLTTRKPTAKNNYTSEWCLGVIPMFVASTRTYARGLCASYNSTLSLPENKEEFQALSLYSKAVSNMYEKMLNKTIPKMSIAVGGEYTPKCKALIMRDEIKLLLLPTNEDCGRHNNLFSFDESNTDPTFAIDRIGGDKQENLVFDDGLKLTWYASCLVMEADTYDSGGFPVEDLEKHITNHGRFYMDFCDGREAKREPVMSVLCGRPPL